DCGRGSFRRARAESRPRSGTFVGRRSVAARGRAANTVARRAGERREGRQVAFPCRSQPVAGPSQLSRHVGTIRRPCARFAPRPKEENLGKKYLPRRREDTKNCENQLLVRKGE